MSVGWCERTIKREIERDRERGTERHPCWASLSTETKSSQCEEQRSGSFGLLSRPFGHTVPTKRAGPWLEACVVVFFFFAICHPEDMFR